MRIVYIQSNLEYRHQQALDVAQEAQNVLNLIISECSYASEDLKCESLSPTKNRPKDMVSSCLFASTTTNYTTGRVREPKSFFRDDVSYTKSIVEYAVPFLKEFKKTISFFTTASLQDVLVRAKKSLANWKASSDSKERAPQGDLSKGGILFSDNIKPEDRSLLGVQHTTDWLDTFNIDCVMQMDPLKHKEYAQTRDIANDLSREALQEKVLFLY